MKGRVFLLFALIALVVYAESAPSAPEAIVENYVFATKQQAARRTG